jgi:hypothetical protein
VIWSLDVVPLRLSSPAVPGMIAIASIPLGMGWEKNLHFLISKRNFAMNYGLIRE